MQRPHSSSMGSPATSASSSAAHKCGERSFGEGFVRNQIATGSNGPPFLRVNGPARNLDAFHQAFGVKPKDKMYIAPAQRVHVW